MVLYAYVFEYFNMLQCIFFLLLTHFLKMHKG